MEHILSPKTALIVLLIIGAISFVLLIATLFTSLTEKALDIKTVKRVIVGTPDFQTAVESITGSRALARDSAIEIFTNGNLFLEDLIGEIESAQSSVTITNYIFREGVMTNSTFDALTKAAERGVEVRLLLDAVGGYKSPEDRLEKLKAAGGRYEFFRSTNLRSLTRIHRRTHVRAIVIDGKIGYTGGLAFQDEWLGDGTSETDWRDMMFKYDGELARATQDHFNSLWRQTNGEILTGESFYPTTNLHLEPREDLYFVSLLHTPAPDVSADLLDLIWITVTGAENHIYLSTPYLTPTPEILEALKEAVERGVRVEVVVPGPYTDAKIIQSATRSYYETLLEAGVHIYEYQSGRFHEKAMTVDGHWSLIGSPNMDNRSATLNVENVFGLEDSAFAKLLEEEFELNKSRSQEIVPEEWRPNRFKRIYYRLTSLFAKQF